MTYEPHVREVVRSRALLTDRCFRDLWLTQGLAQTAQNAMLFGLLVVVLSITGSSIHTSILVFSFIVPSIPMGFVVGVVLDRTHKGHVLVLTNLLRAGGCLLFLFFHGNEWVIYGISIAFATAGLFFNPAVVSLIPSIVSRDRLVPANSLYNFTLTAAQLVGIVFLAPTLLQAVGPDGLFIACAVIFLAAAALATRLRIAHEVREPKLPQGAIFGGIPTDFRESWRVLASDRYSFLALSQLILSSTLVLLFAILIPRYMQEVLGVAPENAAFVFAPTGIGALVGLRFLSWFTKKGKNRAVVIGLVGVATCMVLLALVKPLAEITEQAPGTETATRLLRVSLLQALTMSFAGPMGFFYALLNAPAQTVLHERAPAEMRGRIFATQVVSANFVSLLPLLIVGVVTDLLHVPLVLTLLAAGVLAMAAVSAAIGEHETEKREPERRPQGVST